MEKRLIEDEIHELNNKLDALLGIFLSWYTTRFAMSKAWAVGYLSDCGLSVEYIATVTGLKEEVVRKEKLRAKMRKSRPPSFWDRFMEK